VRVARNSFARSTRETVPLSSTYVALSVSNARSVGWQLLLLRFHAADFGVHGEIVAALLRNDVAGHPIIALHRALRHHVEAFVPFAEGFAEPRRLGLERRQAQLFPNLLRVFHIFALGQRNGGERLLQRRVEQHRGILAAIAQRARAVTL